MHLALRTRGGRMVVIEPDPTSAAEFARCALDLGLDHVSVVNKGAWDSPSTLQLFVDPSHPATNFVAGTVDYPSDRMADFTPIDVAVDTLDSIIEDLLGTHEPIRLLSITTNNSEREILQGSRCIIEAGLQYLALARTGAGYHDMMAGLDYDFLASDDRGYTYIRKDRRCVRDAHATRAK